MTALQAAATPGCPTVNVVLEKERFAAPCALETSAHTCPRILPPTLGFPVGLHPVHVLCPAQSRDCLNRNRLPRTVSTQASNITKDRDSNSAIISKNHPTKQEAGVVLTKADLAEVSRNTVQISHVLQDRPTDTN